MHKFELPMTSSKNGTILDKISIYVEDVIRDVVINSRPKIKQT